MTTAILYARYSTAMQSQASVEDQFRILRQRAEREGWTILAERADRAISGTVRDRPGLLAAMASIETRQATVLLAESLDRISRDQEDLANLYKRARFAGARIVTLSEGEVGTLHIGMGGTMSALFLEQLGEKVRRGQRGVVAGGRIPGGISYGYRKVREFGADGEPIRGLREIDESQAAIVRRIFAEYAEGKSPLAIARQLNAEGVASPRGGLWRANAITGHRKRRNGILNNELYRGRILYNRQSFRKDPETRKRVSRANDAGEMVEHDVPELRIVDGDLWERVQARLAQYAGDRPEQARRPKRLLSGLLRCGECGGSYTIIAKDYWGCSSRRQTGTCSNSATIRSAEAEERIWVAVREDMLHPDAIAAYVDEMQKGAAELRRLRIAARAGDDKRLAEIEREQDRITAAVLAGVQPEKLKARADELEAERAAIEATRDDLSDLDRLLAHPALVESYRRRCASLAELAAGGQANAEHARKTLTSLVDHVEVTPRADGAKGVELALHGDLAAILGLQNDESPAVQKDGEASSLTMVAGVGFEPTTFRL